MWQNGQAASAIGNFHVMTIENNGQSARVGIGTTAPNYNLEVIGSGRFSDSVTADVSFMGQVPTYGAANAQFSHKDRTGAGQYSFLSANDGTTFINAKSGYDIYFRINNSTVGIITSNGYFGIGTASPASYPLTVDGSGSTSIRVRYGSAVRYRSDWGVDSSGNTFMNSYDDTGGVYKPFNVTATTMNLTANVTVTGTLNVTSTASVNNTLTANDNIVMAGGEFYYGGTASNRFARTYVSGTANAGTLNFSFYSTNAWYIRATIDHNGNAAFVGTLSASNFSGSSSGTNTGDQTNISGNAATVGNLTPIQFFNNMGNTHSTWTDFNSINGFGFRFVQGSTNGPGTGSSQFYGFSIGLGNEYPFSDYALQFAIPRYNFSSVGGGPDRYLSIRSRENTTWNAWQKIWAGYADTAGALTSMNISQFTNNSGYLTAESDTLAAVTARGASTTTRTTFTEVGATRNGADTVADGPWFRWTNAAETRQMLTQLNASNGLTTWSYNGSAWNSVMTLTQAGALTIGSNLSMAGNRLTISGTEGQVSFLDSAGVWTGYVGFSGNLGILSFPGRNVEITAGYNGTIYLNNGNTGYNSGVVIIPWGRLQVTNGYIEAGSYITAGGDLTTNGTFYTTANGPSIYQNRMNAGWNSTGDAIDFWINYEGYQNSNTYFRDFRVGNGKRGGAILFIDGSAGTTEFSGDVGIGTAPAFRLDTSVAGAVISGTATTGSNMKGIRIYNTTSAVSNNAVGLWFATGPHQAGIASFRATADTTWETTLAFYTHVDTTSALNDATEKMRISGNGNVLIGATNADVGGSVKGIRLSQDGGGIFAINGSSLAHYQSPLAVDRMNTAGDGTMIGFWREGQFKGGINIAGSAVAVVTGDNNSQTERVRILNDQ